MSLSPLAEWVVGFLTDKQVWATFIAAAMGFGGVIFTLEFQHRSSLGILAEQERQAGLRLAGALLAELDEIEKYSSESARDFESAEYLEGRMGAHVPKCLPFVLGDALVGKLDLLEQRQVRAILNCYLFAKDVPVRLRLLHGHEQFESENYVFVLPVHAPLAAGLFRGLEKLAQQATETLKR